MNDDNKGILEYKDSQQLKWNQLSNAITLICNQDQTIWNIFGYFWGTNALLLIALFSTEKLLTNSCIGIIVSSLGAMLSLLWRFIQKRAIAHMNRFESTMLKLEDSLKIDSSVSLSGKRNVEDYNFFIGEKGGVARKWIIISITLIMIIWILSLIYFISQSIKSFCEI